MPTLILNGGQIIAPAVATTYDTATGLGQFPSAMKADILVDCDTASPTIYLPNLSLYHALNSAVKLTITDNTKTAATFNIVVRCGVSRVTNKVLTSNVVTLTTPTAHGLAVGDSVIVAGVDAVCNGTYTITAVTAQTFSYAKVNANIASAAAAGTVTSDDTFSSTEGTAAATTITMAVNGASIILTPASKNQWLVVGA